MGRLCSLELRLRPAGVDAGVPSLDSSRSRSKESMENSQRLTILYDGKICVCDATEIQARAILCLANSETEERLESPPPLPALSMKRSLQRFLQKRRSRLQAASPYKQ